MMMGENEHFQEIKIDLLTEDSRLHAFMPNYQNHQMLYFENPEVFEKKQAEQAQKEKARKAGGIGGRVREAKVQETESRFLQFIKSITESEQIDFIGKVIPQFGDCLREL